MPLPPLSKGGGLTARHKLLLYSVLLAMPPHFLFAKPFCRQDGGIAFLPHPFRFSDTSANNPSVTVTENTILCLRIFNFYKKQYWKRCASLCQLPLHKGAKGDSALPTLPKPHYPLLCTIALASLVKGEVLLPEKIRTTTGEIAVLPSIARTDPSKTALSHSLFVGEELAPPVAS